MPNRRELGYVSAGSTSTIVATSGYGVATGGTSSSITVSSQNYTLLTFTSDGNLVVSTAGLMDFLIFGAGGSGGSGGATTRGGGGGGAGELFTATLYVPAATYAVTIGVGGVAVNDSWGQAGTQTKVGSLFNAGGGMGGGFQTATALAGGSLSFPSTQVLSSGGSGGGAAENFPAVIGATSTLYAFTGGLYTGSNTAGGGGGGCQGVGAANAGSTTGGAGGAGYDVSTFISGSALYKGGGGGGGGSAAGGAGGSSVGGAGGGNNAAGSAAGANTGSGGGGACGTGGGGGSFGKGGNGGSGIVYVRFKV